MPEIFRVSYVRMYYATYKKRPATPEPVVELRVFFYTDIMPRPEELENLKKGMKSTIDRMELLMNREYQRVMGSEETKSSLQEAKELDTVEPHEDWDNSPIVVRRPVRPSAKMEIDGWEVEEVDLDEMRYGWKEENVPSFFEFRLPYRYIAFFDENGNIKVGAFGQRYEYDEVDIRAWEDRARLVEIRDIMARLVGRFYDIMLFTRRLEESRRKYEEMIKKLEEL